ncbi:hypothetical protein Tco_1186462 [Tanacetum coccineum]
MLPLPHLYHALEGIHVDGLWDTVEVKSVNGEVQLQALVDKKKVVITESTIRRDLQLEDVEGTDFLPNATIFEQLTLMGFEGVTDWYQSQGYREPVIMSSATSAVTYTSVYTDSEPGRAFWGADDEEVSEGGIPRVIVLGYDGLPIQPVAPPSPDYIPGPEDPQTPEGGARNKYGRGYK